MRALLLDYDGTLARVNENQFVQEYFQRLKDFVFTEYSLTISFRDILECAEHITNFADGKKNNYVRFLSCFAARYQSSIDWKVIFDRFYQSKFFDDLSVFVKPNLPVIELLRRLRTDSYKVVLATNPVFPKTAVLKRIDWIGLNESDFDFITYMENSYFCKPDPRYFLGICSIISVKPENCIMIGNDDMFDKSCEKVGIKYLPVEKIEGGEWDGTGLAEREKS
ncbi:MAG: HAD family hydrolase [Pseudothermotoga sp.]